MPKGRCLTFLRTYNGPNEDPPQLNPLRLVPLPHWHHLIPPRLQTSGTQIFLSFKRGSILRDHEYNPLSGGDLTKSLYWARPRPTCVMLHQSNSLHYPKCASQLEEMREDGVVHMYCTIVNIS